ncbi:GLYCOSYLTRANSFERASE [Salix viminalis]|uniref:GLYCOSYLTRANSFERASE n=1 Tax=Salix viminalis TaxID=40686 RepID=A0A9Q0NNR3_SALVM|nr:GLYCOSYLTRANSFERASE [Salix viminalis]
MAGSSKLHIAMFPWLAFGHMIPYLELAKLIAQKGHKISFISTPRNTDRLPKLHPSISPLITFVKLSLPQVENLPKDAEATTDVPYDKVQYLKQAYDSLKEPLSKFLESCDDLDCVLFDFAPYWLPDIATSLGIPNVIFSIFTAAALSCVKPASAVDDRSKPEDFTFPPKWVTFPTNVTLRLFEVLRIFDQSIDPNVVSDFYRLQEGMKGCDMIAVRSCMEFEPEWLHLLEEIHGKPVIPVGVLATTEYDTGEENQTWRSMKDWLDKKKKGSIVYIAFGSEAKPSQVELTEIALGLELSGLPFIWVLRKHRGSVDTESIELPEGFEKRTRAQGLVCTSWAPQLKILAHDSVGGFLTHSGWSSVVEALQHARALILLTFLADQGINARVLEEKKMGYSIPRNEKSGYFTRDSVAESLRLVMEMEEGKVYRDKAKEMRPLFADKDQQDKYVEKLLDHLKSHGRIKKIKR